MVGQFENSLVPPQPDPQHVDTLELHADMTENANNGGGETALRKERTLHKQNDIRAVDFVPILWRVFSSLVAWSFHGSVCR